MILTTLATILNVLAVAGVSRMFTVIFWGLILIILLAAVGAALRGRQGRRREFRRRMEEGRREVRRRRGIAERWGWQRKGGS